MLAGISRTHITRAEQPGGISPAVHSVLAVFISKEPRPSRCWRRGINISGVDFWHAVEFSRNGRFLRTHPRDSLRLSSGRFPSVLRFRLYQTLSLSDFLGAFQDFALPSAFLSGGSDFIRSFSDPIPRQKGAPSRPLGRSDVPNLSGSSRRFPIGAGRARRNSNSGMPKLTPSGDRAGGLMCRCCGGSVVEEPLRLRGNPENVTELGGAGQASLSRFFLPAAVPHCGQVSPGR
jgi:hypothetical protein